MNNISFVEHEKEKCKPEASRDLVNRAIYRAPKGHVCTIAVLNSVQRQALVQWSMPVSFWQRVRTFWINLDGPCSQTVGMQ